MVLAWYFPSLHASPYSNIRSTGSRALNQETAHSQELFLLNECDDIAVATIFQKCDVRFLDVNESEEPDKDDPEARNYFCR
jgi:DNA (cytosine-5)-methyltransferase 1